MLKPNKIYNQKGLLKVLTLAMVLAFSVVTGGFAGEPCGFKDPDGCIEGKKCYKVERNQNVVKSGIAADLKDSSSISYECHTEEEVSPSFGKSLGNLITGQSFKYTEVSGSEGNKNTSRTVSMATGIGTSGSVDEEGNVEINTTVGYESVTINVLNNKACKIADMRKLYQSKCYACVIVKTLLETFLTACSKTYDITREAGSKVLVIGSLIWLAFFAFKNVSSFANVEPGALVNTLFVFLFKVMVAYIIINSGLTTIIHYTINPLLTAGADYGLGLMSIMQETSGVSNYDIVMPVIKDGNTQTEILSADVMNKIMLFTENLDKTVSTNLVIGHALTCHALNAGAWDLVLFFMVNLWIWLCGAAIWFCGFMLTLSICYYLLDISFKLGFAVLALPVVIGLWPFNLTKDKLKTCLSIIFSSAATFAFLALTTTYALVLISSAMRDLPTLFAAIERGDAIWISETFDITGPYLLIILFAYLYSIKLIGSTISDYVDKFFSDGVFGSQSPMHHKLTQATDIVKQKALGAGGFAYDALKTQAGKAGSKALGGIGNMAKSAFKGGEKAPEEAKDRVRGDESDKPKADGKPKADDTSKTTKK